MGNYVLVHEVLRWPMLHLSESRLTKLFGNKSLKQWWYPLHDKLRLLLNEEQNPDEEKRAAKAIVKACEEHFNLYVPESISGLITKYRPKHGIYNILALMLLDPTEDKLDRIIEDRNEFVLE